MANTTVENISDQCVYREVLFSFPKAGKTIHFEKLHILAFFISIRDEVAIWDKVKVFSTKSMVFLGRCVSIVVICHLHPSLLKKPFNKREQSSNNNTKYFQCFRKIRQTQDDDNSPNDAFHAKPRNHRR